MQVKNIKFFIVLRANACFCAHKFETDIFTKFVESNGKFKESLAENARAILSLYEAAHMRVHGEDVLEEALDFSVKHLKNIISNSSPIFVAEVTSALKYPLRKAIPRMKAREYIPIYEEDPSHSKTLLTFSKLDFNILQKLHQKELIEVIRFILIYMFIQFRIIFFLSITFLLSFLTLNSIHYSYH